MTKTLVIREKAPIIPSLLVDTKFVTNFAEKAEFFNDFFSSQCQPISHHSTLPLTLSFETTNHLSTVDIKQDKILKVFSDFKSK